MLWNRFRIISVLLFGFFVVSIVSCKETKASNKSEKISIQFKKEGTLQLLKTDNDTIIKALDIEVADDDYQIQTGLMYRDQLKENHAMLFIFPTEEYKSFYMKNTRIPLDIIYIAADSSIVSFQKNAEPFKETSLPSEAPVKYVLEVNAGLSDSWKLEKGNRIRFTIRD